MAIWPTTTSRTAMTASMVVLMAEEHALIGSTLIMSMDSRRSEDLAEVALRRTRTTMSRRTTPDVIASRLTSAAVAEEATEVEAHSAPTSCLRTTALVRVASQTKCPRLNISMRETTRRPTTVTSSSSERMPGVSKTTWTMI